MKHLLIQFKTSRGFTLIELLISIGIFMFFASKALPMIGTWQESLALSQINNQLNMAISSAKSYSQMNEFSKPLSHASSIVCISENEISVRGATQTDEAGCTSAHPLIWSNSIRFQSKILIPTNNNFLPLQCICYRPSGLTKTSGSNCSACARSSEFKIKNGGSNEIIRLT